MRGTAGGSPRPGQVIVGRRYFTVSQADRALVLVSQVVADVRQLYAQLLDLQEEAEASERRGGSPGPVREEMVGTAERLHACLKEFDEIGVELMDWTKGVVDFPCRAGGREVRLCWQAGEPHIAFWHEATGCGDDRLDIATLPVRDSVEVS